MIRSVFLLFLLLTSVTPITAFAQPANEAPLDLCNDPADSAQVRLLMQMLVPVFSCPKLDEAGGCYKTQSSLQ